MAATVSGAAAADRVIIPLVYSQKRIDAVAKVWAARRARSQAETFHTPLQSETTGSRRRKEADRRTPSRNPPPAIHSRKADSAIERLPCVLNAGSRIEVMTEITPQVCDVTCQSFFKKAILFNDARCGEVAQKCLEAFTSYGLRANQIDARNGDQTFKYELSFSLFNGNGKFKFTSEKLELEFHNAISDKDLEVVQDCVAKVYEQVPLPEIGNTLISVNAHATLSSIEAMQRYLAAFAKPEKRIVASGAIAYVLCEKWPQEVRLMIDRSLIYPAGLFLAWSTTNPQKGLSREVLKNVREAFDESLMNLDLTFTKTILS